LHKSSPNSFGDDDIVYISSQLSFTYMSWAFGGKRKYIAKVIKFMIFFDNTK